MRTFISCLSLLLVLAWLPLKAAELEQANAFVAAGELQKAYELLAPLEFELSGNEDFDLLFGYTVLELGHISLATLAFERVLAVNPDNTTGRFHLARAFYALSDFDGARREFEVLLSMNPSSGLRETVGQYMDAIAARRPSARTSYAGYLSLGIGTDNNVNSASATNPVFFPLIGDTVLFDRADIRDGDNYGSLGAGLTLTHQLSEQSLAYGSADMIYQKHGDRQDLDYGLLALGGGMQHAMGNHSVRGGVNGGYLLLDNQSYQRYYGVDLEWRTTLAKRTQVALVGAYTTYRHRQRLDRIEDYDDVRLTASVLRVFGEQGAHLVSAALEGGREQARRGRDDGDMDYLGLRLTGQVSFGNGHNGYLSLSWKDKRYQQQNLLFNRHREETQFQAVAGLNLSIAKTWSLRPNISYVDQNSNIDLYTYDRASLSVLLRKDFL